MQTVSQPALENRLKVAVEVTREAGALIMTHYGRIASIQTKSTQVDLVTNADLEADGLISSRLKAHFPEDTLVTEESFDEIGQLSLDHAWVVDPIDGTTNFAHSFPHFAVSIAYVEAGQPKVGVIYDPVADELFTAVVGQGTRLNDRPIQVSDVEQLGKSLLATGFPYTRQFASRRENNLEHFERFMRHSHGVRRAGSAALDLAYVAVGRLDGFWELKLSPWDVAAGMVLIGEAGGKVTGLTGQPLDLNQRQINIVGSNGRIHQEMIQLLAEES